MNTVGRITRELSERPNEEIDNIYRTLNDILQKLPAGASQVIPTSPAPPLPLGVRVKGADGSPDLFNLEGVEFTEADGFTITQTNNLATIGLNFGLHYQDASIPGGNTVANTTTETALTSKDTFAANELAVGDVIRVSLAGRFGTAAAGPTLRVKIKYGTTVLIDTTAVTITGSLTSLAWEARVLFHVTAIGATGAIEGSATFLFSTAATTAIATLISGGSVTVDTTASSDLTVTVQWGTADASNTISLRQMVVEVL